MPTLIESGLIRLRRGADEPAFFAGEFRVKRSS
jgi:hypothetical protein